MDHNITLYISSVSSNIQMKKQQQKMADVLEAKKIPFELVDIATIQDAKERMRELCGDPRATPPRIFKGERYLGDFDQFEDAVETETLHDFLSL